MRYLVYRWLPALAVGLVLCGCGAIGPRPEPMFPSVILNAAPAGASMESAREVQPADPWRNLSLHVYGLSYHPDREGARRSRVDNEANLGLGLSYEFHNDDRGAAFFAAGFYKDSGRNWAKLAGPGYQFKLGDRWRFGATFPVIQSRTYNSGRTFIAPIPLLTYDLGGVKLNAAYVPRFQQYNNFATVGFYLSIPFSK